MIETDIEWEYHSQYLTQNSYNISGEEGEPEPAITPPPPTAPELEDPLLFDPKVTGIWDHLIALMTDEQKAQLKEAAKSEQVTPSFRHVPPTPREASPSSEGAKSRGPHEGIRYILEELQLQHTRQRLLLISKICKILFFHVGKGKQQLSFQVPHGYSVL